MNGLSLLNNPLDSSLSDDRSDEEQSSNENKLPAKQKHEPRPPSAPPSEDNRRHRRRHRHQTVEEIEQSSKNTDSSSHPPIDPLNSHNSRRRNNIFQSFKSKKEKIPLPRPSSACMERSDEKPDRKRRPSTSLGKLRPARVNILDERIDNMISFFSLDLVDHQFSGNWKFIHRKTGVFDEHEQWQWQTSINYESIIKYGEC